VRILILVTLLFSHLAAASSGTQLSSFETDYCTNYPEGTLSEPDLWKHCCLIHDMYFWAGGEKVDRNNADLELRSCIEATGAINQARIMYYAVRAGSYSPVKYPDRKWNNGWKDRADFQVLSFEDIVLISEELNCGYEFISPEIKIHFILQLQSRLGH
jgi:hypothetical protein